MAEFTRRDLVDFGVNCKDYFVAFDDGAAEVMHFVAKVADINATFTTDLHDALQLDDENTAFLFANLINALYPNLDAYIVELTYDFSFYCPNAVDFSKLRRNTDCSAD